MTWRFDRAQAIDVSGRFWRMLSPRWSFDPLSGAGAALAGGRWNERGHAALYMSGSELVAIAEYHQGVARPGTLTAYDVSASGILDLSDPAQREAIEFEHEMLALPWRHIRDVERRRPACWDFAAAAAAQGWTGLRVPSVHRLSGTGLNLVLWHWNDGAGASVAHVDPFHDLPRSPASWKD